MEKILNPYDKECMRMAMLKHEETFREQVYELHRLYQIQKILMKNIKNSYRHDFKNSAAKNQQIIDHLDNSKKTLQGFDLEQPAEEYNIAENVEIAEENELELTLGPSSFFRRMRAAAGDSDSGPSFSSSSTGSSHSKRTTLSGNHQKTIIRSRNQEIGQKWRLDNMPISNNPTFLGERKNNSDVEEHLRQQDRLNNNNPAWLFQVLSLNMTT